MSINIRKARPEDKAAIIKISKQIWEGEDYVPEVLNEWLSSYGLWVAEIEDRVVGFAKISELSPGELWLEGLRVDPKYRKLGIAKALAKVQLEQCMKRSPMSIRLATGEISQASICIAHELGFRQIGQFTYMFGPVQSVEDDDSSIDRIDNSEVALNYILNSKIYLESCKLLPHGWIFKEVSESLINKLVQSGKVFCCRKGDKVTGIIILLQAPHRPKKLAIAYPIGEKDTLHDLINFAHLYGSKNGYNELRTMAPNECLVSILSQHGLSYDPDFRCVLVYEYPL